MATCGIDLSNEQLLNIYQIAYKFLEIASENKEDLDFDKAAKMYYDGLVSRGTNETVALAHAQHLPGLIAEVATTYRAQKFHKLVNTNQLLDKSDEWAEDFTNVVNHFKTTKVDEQRVTDSKLSDEIKKKSKKNDKSEEITKEIENYIEEEDNNELTKKFSHKKASVAASTGQQGITNWLGFATDVADPDVSFIYNFLNNFKSAFMKQGSDMSTLTLGGHTGFSLTAKKKSAIKDGKIDGKTVVHKRDQNLLAGRNTKNTFYKKLTKKNLDAWKERAIEEYNANKEMIEAGTDPKRFKYAPSLQAIENKYKAQLKRVGETGYLPASLSEKAGATLFNNTTELFITDNDGNILLFDENYNITPDGKAVYFPISAVKFDTKTGKYALVKRNEAESVMTPEEIAIYENKDTWSELTETGKNMLVIEAEQKQQRELEIIYNLNKAFNTDRYDLKLDITSVKAGVTSVNFTKTTKASDVDFVASGLKALEVVSVAERDNTETGEKKGAAYLRLPGHTKSVYLQARNRSEEEATALAELLFNDDLSILHPKRGKIPMSPEKRIELFETHVVLDSSGTTQSGIGLQVKNVNNVLNILYKGKSTINDKAITKQDVVDILTQPLSDVYFAKFKAGEISRDKVFNKLMGQIKMPAMGSKKNDFLEVFTIDDDVVAVTEVNRLNYILENTTSHVSLAQNKTIPILNGHISFDISNELADQLELKTDGKEILTIEEEISQTEKELDDVNKLIKELEEKDVEDEPGATGKFVTKLNNDFSGTVLEQVTEKLTPEETAAIAEEEGVDESEVAGLVAKRVEQSLNGDKVERKSKKDSTLVKVAKTIARVIRNMLIAFSLYVGTTAYSPTEGTYNLNNTVETTASIIDVTPLSEYSETFVLGMAKLGVYDVSKDEATISLDSIKETQGLRNLDLNLEKQEAHTKYKKQNTFFEIIDKVKDSHYKARKGKQDMLLSARNQWFNEDGFTYVSGAIQSRMSEGEVIKKVEGVAHFMILDDLGIDLSTKTTDQELLDASKSFKKQRIGRDIKMTDYVPVFNRDGEKVNVKYKLASELDSNDIAITRLHQYKFSDINFNSKASAKPFGFHGGGVYALKNKSGKALPNFLFTTSGKNAYSRFSGGSYVLIFKDKLGNEVVHDVSGSLNMLDKEGSDIAKAFDIPKSSITLGIYDAGSYSAKPAADKDGNVDTDQYRNYNKLHPHSGGALLYPEVVPEDDTPDPITGGLFMLLTPLALMKQKRKGTSLDKYDLELLKGYKKDLEVKLKQLHKDLAASKEEAKVQVEPLTNPGEVLAKDTTKQDVYDAFDDIVMDKPKGRFRFEKLLPGHKAKAKKAIEDYGKSVVSKYFPVTNAMHVVNSNAYATWTKNGITLYAGASYTDLYHEAFHGFSQFFLTQDEKISLYNEVSKTTEGKKALAKYAKVNNRKLGQITDPEMYWVMEELLAEDYRKYRLSGAKNVLKGRSVRNTIFRRIYNFLKELFTGVTVDNSFDQSTITRVKKLYDTLRLTEEGQDLVNYSPSELNMMPGWKQLRSGIVPFAEDSTTNIAYADSLLINESLDSIFSDIVLEQLNERGPEFASAVFSSRTLFPVLYGRALTIFKERLAEIDEKIVSETDMSELKVLNTKRTLLNFAIENIGSQEEIIAALKNETDKGVVAYHLKKSKYLEYVPDKMSREALEAMGHEQEAIIRQEWEKPSNEIAMEELASNMVRSLLSSAKKYDSKGNVVMNRLDFAATMEFGPAFATMVKLTKDLDDPAIMKAELEKAGEIPVNSWIKNDILPRLGPIVADKRSSFKLWTDFWQAFYKAEISFDQLTFKRIREKLPDSNRVVTVVKTLFGRPSAVFRHVEYDWISKFESLPEGEFTTINENGETILNVEAIKAKYKGNPRSNAYQFLHDIGLPIADNPKVIQGVEDAVNLGHMYDKLVAVDARGEDITNPLYSLRWEYPKKNQPSLANESTNLDTVLDLHARYSGEFANVAIKNPKGNAAYEQTLNSSYSRTVQAFNKAKSFEELIAMPHMDHLNPERNSQILASNRMYSLFDMDDVANGRPKRPGASISITNSSGALTTEDGLPDYDFSTLTSRSDKYTRLIIDMQALLTAGRPSNQNPADKGTVLSNHVNNILIKDGGKKISKFLYVDTVDFLSKDFFDKRTNQGELKAYDILRTYLQGEIDLIKRIERGDEVNSPGYTTDILYEEGDKIPEGKKVGDVKMKARGKNFQLFDGIFTPSTKKKLLAVEGLVDDYLLTDAGKELRETMYTEYLGFVETEYEDHINRLGPMFFAGETLEASLKKMMIDKNWSLEVITERELSKDKDSEDYSERKAANLLEREKAFIKSYALNLIIHNVENVITLFGNMAMYDDFAKRNPGFNSDGSQFRNDKAAQAYINREMFGDKPTYRSKMNFEGLADRVWDGTLNTTIFAETIVKSILLAEYKGAFEEHFIKIYGFTSDLTADQQAEIDAAVSIRMKPYESMEEGDGQGWLTFDAYKMLGELEGKWSPAQDKLYHQILAGKELTLDEVDEYFPVRKYQYFGHLKTTGVPLVGFHKYSLAPLVPNVISGRQMEVLHNNLVKQNMDYGTFQSSSKVNTVIKKGATKADALWEDLVTRTAKEVGVYDGTPATQTYTPNVLFIEYLKDQLDINSKFKGKNTFSTQLRKLIEDGSVVQGVPTDYLEEGETNAQIAAWKKLTSNQKLNASPVWARVKNYEHNIAVLVERRKSEFLEKAGWTEEQVENGTGDLKSLIELIHKEMERQDIGEHELNFIMTDKTGKNLLHDLSMSPSAEKIERVLTSFINNTLVKQKVKGESLVQMATTLMDVRNATEEERAEYAGTTDLESYRQEFDDEGNVVRTLGADAKIALQGDFKKLLYIKHKDGDIIGVRDDKGNILEDASLDRLNETINDPEWRMSAANLRKITLIGVRIPVQGYNSMEFFHIKEFLPQAAGNIIIAPSEIVAKSGADFDIDKLTMMMPNLSNINGDVKIVQNSTSTRSKSEIKAERDELKTERTEVRDEYSDKLKEVSKTLGKEFNVEVNEKYYPELDKKKLRLVALKKEYGATTSLLKLGYKAELVEKLERLEKRWDTLEGEIIFIEDSISTDKGLIGQSVRDSAAYQALKEEKNSKLNPINEKIGVLTEELEGISSKATENEIMGDLYSFLTDPRNFIRLITPNDTTLVKGKADEMRERFANDPNKYNPNRGWKKAPGGKAAVTPGAISPTKHFTGVHNNHLHEVNSVGKDTLGLGAVDNTFNVLLNRIGAHMNPYYGSGFEIPLIENKKGEMVPKYATIMEYKAALVRRKAKLLKIEERNAKQDAELLEINIKLSSERRIKLFLDHNVTKFDGETVISLSHAYDAKMGNSISDIINQLINGWVDIAKGAWIFDVQGNKVASPALLFLVQAGTPFNQAVDFLSNPLITEYVDEQIRVLSPAGIMDPQNKLRSDSIINARKKARDIILTKYGKAYFDYEANPLSPNYGQLKSNQSHIHRVASSLINDKNAKEILANMDDVIDGKKPDSAFRLFMHYLEIENHAGSMKKLKMTLNYDTSRSTTLLDAAKSISKYDTLLKNTSFPRRIITDIVEESPIGSFQIQEFIMKLWGPLFPLRTHEELNTFMIDLLSDSSTLKDMQRISGTEDKYLSSFRNDILVYSFLQDFDSFDIDNLDAYKGLNISTEGVGIEKSDALLRGVGVVEDKNGNPVVYLDKDALEDQFRLGTYSNEPYTSEPILNRYIKAYKGYNNLNLSTVPLEAFNTKSGPRKQEYFKFVLEREMLRYNNSVESLMKTTEFAWRIEATRKTAAGEIQVVNNKEETAKDVERRVIRTTYEDWLRDTALDNILNFWKLFNSKDTVADKFVAIKREHRHLESEYAVIFDIGTEKLIIKSEDEKLENSLTFNNLKLRDNRLTGDQINGYHENLLRLQDPNVMKVVGDNEAAVLENKRLSNFFEMLPVYSFLQSGLNATERLSLSRVMPYEKLTSLLEKSVKNTIEILNDPSLARDYLSGYYNAFNAHNERTPGQPMVNKKTRNIKQALRPSLEDVRLSLEATDDSQIYEFTTGTSESEFLEVVDKNPDVYFIVEKGSMDNKAYLDGLGNIPMRDNMKFITTRQFATNKENSFIKENEMDMALLENEMNDLNKLQLNGATFAFSGKGYGAYMLEVSKDSAREFNNRSDYVRLSSALYNAVGYANPNSKYFQTSAKAMQSRTDTDQIISDATLEKAYNDEIEGILDKIDCGG